jgi:hypothetical protein
VDPDFSYIGSSVPLNTASLTNTFGFLDGRVRIYTMLDYKGDFYVTNTNGSFLCTNNAASADRSNPDAPLADQAACVASLRTSTTTTYGYLDKGDFLRLREVSATIRLPDRLVRLARAGDASLSIGGRNLAVWSKFGGADPEMNYSTGDLIANIASSSPRTYYTFRLNLDY